MSTAVTEKTSLEWFFAPPASSNFPQLAYSSTLANLMLIYEKYVASYFSAIPPTVENRADWLDLARGAFDLLARSKAQFTMVEGCLLIETLNRFIDKMELLKKNSSDRHAELDKQFKRLLTSLILYAKETSDINFKGQVVEIVRRWETAGTTGN